MTGDTRLLTHEDAAEFDTTYYGFVFGDRPDWWVSPPCVYVFRPLGRKPEASFFVIDLDEAVEFLYAYHYDVDGAVVRPQWSPDPTRPKGSPVPEHALSVAKQWERWRAEREELSAPVQYRAIRQQLFQHAPRKHEPGVVFAFSELPATVQTLDPREAVTRGRARVAASKAAMDSFEVKLASALAAVLEGQAFDAGLLVGLVAGGGTPPPLHIPADVVRRLTRATPFGKGVREAYKYAREHGHPVWKGRPDKDPAFPPARWSNLTADERSRLEQADATDVWSKAALLNALHFDYLLAVDAYEDHKAAWDRLVARVIDNHAGRGEGGAALLRYFDLSAEEVASAAKATGGSPFALLQLLRGTGHTCQETR